MLLTKPDPRRFEIDRNNHGAYYIHHNLRGLDTNQCRDLQELVEDLVRNGYLREYIDHEATKIRQRQDKQHMFTIAWGRTLAGYLNRARKNYSRISGPKVMSMERASKIQKTRLIPITLTKEDVREISYPHDDALIITANIRGLKVERILVDPGSAVDIMSKEIFEELGVEFITLIKDVTPLYEFRGLTVVLLVRVQLMMTFGTIPHTKIIIMDFTVVDYLSSYQDEEPEEVKISDPRPEKSIQHGESEDELDIVALFGLEKTVKVGSRLEQSLKLELISLLKEHDDVFTWDHQDMPGSTPG